tara:strand:- start:5824 stop:7152 length:1329 start_codon:yes stop_codon:yes gene_type:complete
MKMFQYEDEDGNFIIEHLDSNGNIIPVFQVTGSEVFLSGSLLPADPLNSASAELGSEEKPWKELYVESASINFIDTSKAVGDARRKVRFSRKDVEDLKEGRSLNENGVLSASGDMHVAGNSLFKGTTVYDGVTKLKGETQVTGALRVEGAADFRGQFRVNGNRIQEGELRVLEGITATTDELNTLDGFTGNVADLNYAKTLRATGVTSTEFDKLDGLTATTQELNLLDGLNNVLDEDNMASNSATALATQQSIKAYVDANAGGGGSTDLTAVDSHIIPDGDNTRDLGSSTNEFKDLYIDGTANLDSVVSANIRGTYVRADSGDFITTSFQSKGPHILGGATSGANGVEVISSISITPHLLNARRRNLFIMNVNNGNVHGFVGNGIIGEVVTIIATQRCTVHHAENGVAGASIYKDPRGRDVTMLANTSARFIYAGSYWVRMV